MHCLFYGERSVSYITDNGRLIKGYVCIPLYNFKQLYIYSYAYMMKSILYRTVNGPIASILLHIRIIHEGINILVLVGLNTQCVIKKNLTIK